MSLILRRALLSCLIKQKISHLAECSRLDLEASTLDNKSQKPKWNLLAQDFIRTWQRIRFSLRFAPNLCAVASKYEQPVGCKDVSLETGALQATPPPNMFYNRACYPCSTTEAWLLLFHGRTFS